eukprot:80899-Chlamydomonas_euryale.AAC.1
MDDELEVASTLLERPLLISSCIPPLCGAGCAPAALPPPSSSNSHTLRAQFTTSFTSYALYTNAKSAVGSRRLASYVTKVWGLHLQTRAGARVARGRLGGRKHGQGRSGEAHVRLGARECTGRGGRGGARAVGCA